MKYVLLVIVVLLLLTLAGVSASKSAQAGPADRFVPCSSCSRITRTPTPEEPKPTPTLFETPVCYECATLTPTDDWVPTRNPSPPPPLWTLELSRKDE